MAIPPTGGDVPPLQVSPREVAARIDAILGAGVPPDRLTLVPDCGFSQTARWAATAKLRALVAGRDLVRGGNRTTSVSQPAIPEEESQR